MSHRIVHGLSIANAAYLAALAVASQLVVGSIPEAGTVLWSCRLGSNPRFYYQVQVRVFSDLQYRVVWLHSSGHQNPIVGAYAVLWDATVEALLQRHNYYQAEADDREAAIEAYYADLALEG